MNILGAINSSGEGNALANILDVARESLGWLSLLVSSGDSDNERRVLILV